MHDEGDKYVVCVQCLRFGIYTFNEPPGFFAQRLLALADHLQLLLLFGNEPVISLVKPANHLVDGYLALLKEVVVALFQQLPFVYERGFTDLPDVGGVEVQRGFYKQEKYKYQHAHKQDQKLHGDLDYAVE